MKKVIFIATLALIFIFNADLASVSAQTLLNEVAVSLPGEDQPCEYIEIRGTPGATLSNLYFVDVDGDSSSGGSIDFIVDLNNRTIGSNGLLVIVSQMPCPGRTIAAQTTQVTLARLDIEGSGIENGAHSFLLVSSPTAFTSPQVDVDNDGTLDALPVGATVLDSVGWFQNDSPGTVYGATLSFTGKTPDAATRFPGNNTPNSASAWYYGDIDPAGSNNADIYDSASVSRNFPSGGRLTPGTPNVGEATRVFGRQFDFDGDNKADVSGYRPSNGVWYVLNSFSGFSSAQFGASTDKIVPADYDGDGKTDYAVWREGVWYLLRSSAGFASAQFGSPGDIPMPADFTGDGKAELAVYRPSNGFWYTLNLVNNAFSSIQFGAAEDKPVAADYDGDGKTDYAVYRPSNGTWYMQRSTAGFTAVQFGISTDKPTVGDYDGDGKFDQAVYRPASGTWYFLKSTQGFAATQFGLSTDVPTPANYDGDGKTDVGVFRPENNTWYRLNSANGRFISVQFGIGADKPEPSGFVAAQTIELDYNFDSGTLGWTAGFADYPPSTDRDGSLYELFAGLRFMPLELTGAPKQGFYIQGHNRSDDLFMYLKRRLGVEDGIVGGERIKCSLLLRLLQMQLPDVSGLVDRQEKASN
jgi:hypothetical protein